MPNKALLIVDVQYDFLPGGALGVTEGDRIIPVLNQYIERFERAHLPVLATRDWHPPDTRHFRDFGGPWPVHCVENTPGAAFHTDLKLPANAEVITKGTSHADHGYSAFEGTDTKQRPLAELLRELNVDTIYVGGLATDYCVRNSALDAVKNDFDVVLLLDAVRGIDVNEGDVARSLDDMLRAGARTATLATIDTEIGK
jgi:nicotinamidase/pyrazinamidase